MFGSTTTTKKVIEVPTPGSLLFAFKLGDRVKDTISGLEGTLIYRYYHLSGCDRFTFECDAADGKLGEEIALDGARIALVKAFPERHRNEVPDFDVCLGDKVRDIVSNITGIASVIIVPLHGAMRIVIDPGYDAKDRKMSEAHFADEHLVEVVTPLKKPAPKPKAETAPVVEPRPKTRGPMRLPTRTRY